MGEVSPHSAPRTFLPNEKYASQVNWAHVPYFRQGKEKEMSAIQLTQDSKKWFLTVQDTHAKNIARIDSKSTVTTGFPRHISLLVTYKKTTMTLSSTLHSIAMNIQQIDFEC